MPKNKKHSSKGLPEINSKVLSVRLEFCDRFNNVRDERSLIFFMPASVNHPPQISKDLRFLKSDHQKYHRAK